MPYEGLGLRHECAATKACAHGQIVSEQGFVGSAFKTQQIGRFVDPVTGSPANIAIAEVMEIQIGGVHEAPLAGNLAAAAVGNDVYINTANNTLGLTAQGLTTGNLNAGWLPVGKITELDSTRTPGVARINANARDLVKVGTGL